MKTGNHNQNHQETIQQLVDYMGHDRFLEMLNIGPDQRIETEEEWNLVDKRIKNYVHYIVSNEMDQRLYDRIEDMKWDLIDLVRVEVHRELPELLQEMFNVYDWNPSGVSI